MTYSLNCNQDYIRAFVTEREEETFFSHEPASRLTKASESSREIYPAIIILLKLMITMISENRHVGGICIEHMYI